MNTLLNSAKKNITINKLIIMKPCRLMLFMRRITVLLLMLNFMTDYF